MYNFDQKIALERIFLKERRYYQLELKISYNVLLRFVRNLEPINVFFLSFLSSFLYLIFLGTLRVEIYEKYYF